MYVRLFNKGYFMSKTWMLSVATAIVMLGCGSSNKLPDLVIVPESNGDGVVAALETSGTVDDENISVDGNNTEGKFVTTANIVIPQGTSPKDSRGNSACVKDPCVIQAKQLCVKDTSSCSDKQAEKIASDVPDVGDNEIALYAGTLDITSDSGTLTDCGMTITIDVPECVKWEKSTRENKLHGVPPCATMRVWVAPLCSSDTSKGRWIDAKVSKCKTEGKRTITFTTDGNLPAHVVMFAVMKLNWLTGGSK
jgi:hypothetical protein